MAPSLGSGDGYQPNVYVHDRASGNTELVSKGSGGPADSSSFSPAISADGRYVAFDSAAGNLVGGDANGAEDVFVHDTYTGATDLVSADGGWFGGDQALYPGISPDGSYVAFAVAPLDMSTTQYYLRGPLFGGGGGGGESVAPDPPAQETTITSAPATSTTVAPPTSTTTAVTETTGG
jgi:hypothetical protein